MIRALAVQGACSTVPSLGCFDPDDKVKVPRNPAEDGPVKLVYNANDIVEAHIVAGMLHAEGIEAHVGGHYLQGGVGELPMTGFATVSVPEDDVIEARRIIGRYQADRRAVELPEDALAAQYS
jgi:hypothetical protein